jgi:hypothetical protein
VKEKGGEVKEGGKEEEGGSKRTRTWIRRRKKI